MGYEVAEQLGWRIPQGIIYPTGGGVGLLGMWKAFEEMQALGWIGAERPRMIVVQSAGCAPIVKAWDDGKQSAEMWKDAATLASGLRVPKPYGDYLILDILRKSKGAADQRDGRRARGSDPPLGEKRRNFRRPGRRRLPCGLPQIARQWILQARRHCGPVQHRERFEIPRCVGHESCGKRSSARLPARQIGGIIGPY